VYYIAYKDPMTGTLLEVKAESLADAVSAMQKAKDDLYYRGHSLEKNEDLSTQSPEDEDRSSSENDNHAEDDQDLEEFLYPYGVTLW
jgi:hypothetical protein